MRPAGFLSVLLTAIALSASGATNESTSITGSSVLTTPTPPVSQLMPKSEILTPPGSLTPRINGPKIFGVRPDLPFLHKVRDLWRQKNLGLFDGSFSAPVKWHGVVFIKIAPAS